MKQGKLKKKISSLLLAVAIITTSFPTFITEVHAAELPDTSLFATKEQLKDDYNLNGGTIGKIKFGKNGEGIRKWAICGKDGDNLALLSTTEFAKATYGSNSKYSTSNFVNDLKSGTSTYLGASYFSSKELEKMQKVTVKTLEYDQQGTRESNGRAVISKIYLPDAANRDSWGAESIYVGSGNNIKIDLTKLTSENGFQTNHFWLRSPQDTFNNYTLVAFPGRHVTDRVIERSSISVVPALNLNLSDVSFASAANAASSDGALTTTANEFTLRYENTGSETAKINATGSKVVIANATNNMYLVVQNSTGAYAKALTSATTSVSADEIAGIDDFKNCKVWLETTDRTNRITTAKMAAQEVADIPSVAITDITAPTAGSDFDTSATCATIGVCTTEPTVAWTPNESPAGYNTVYTASMTLTAADNYVFTDTTTATVNGNKATSVKKNDNGTLTITYTFAATAKDKPTSITDPADITVANGTAATPAKPSQKKAVSKTAISSQKKDTPETGDNTPLAGLFILIILSGSGIVYFARKKR